jgi:hypothetical protein
MNTVTDTTTGIIYMNIPPVSSSNNSIHIPTPTDSLNMRTIICPIFTTGTNMQAKISRLMVFRKDERRCKA